MFEHSVKVPRLYKLAAKIVQQVKEEGGSIKPLVFNRKHPNISGVYALVVSTLQRGPETDYLLQQTGLLIKEQRLDQWLGRVLITELLWGKKRLSGESKPILTVLNYRQELEKYLAQIPPSVKREIKKVEKPRYVRVNTNHMSMEEAFEGFQNEGWEFVETQPETSYEEFLQMVKNLPSDQFMLDLHIKELILFPYKTEFFKHQTYINGSIVLQDKASCLPVHLLNPSEGSTIMDMCAAPGMKTTQMAARLNNNAKIYAIESDVNRLQHLKDLLEHTGTTCVEPHLADCRYITHKLCPGVEYILLDPSCSGSGMQHFDIETGYMDKERIGKLHNFQASLLRHALSHFPDAKKVVYSTCSVFPEENEEVVREVLDICDEFRLVNALDLLDGKWKNLGGESYKKIGNKCLYAKPDEDFCNGFFIAVFERVKESQMNKELCLDEADLRNLKEPLESEITSYEKIEEIKEEEHTEGLAKKKKKKIKSDTTEKSELNEDMDPIGINVKEEDTNGKKKKIKKEKLQPEEISTAKVEIKEEKQTNETTEVPQKKKKKKIAAEADNEVSFEKSENLNEELTESEENCKSKKKHKKKKQSNADCELTLSEAVLESDCDTHKKRKKKKKSFNQTESIVEENWDSKKKHKKKCKDTNEAEVEISESDIQKQVCEQLEEHLNKEASQKQKKKSIDKTESIVVKNYENKKKRKDTIEAEVEISESNIQKQVCEQLEEYLNEEASPKQKKKKKHKQDVIPSFKDNLQETESISITKKKRKTE